MTKTQPPTFDSSSDSDNSQQARLLRLNAVTLALAQVASRPALLAALSAQIGGLFAFDHASLTLSDGSTWQPQPLGGLASAPEVWEAAQQALATREPVMRAMKEIEGVSEEFGSIFALPLLTDDGHLLGTLQLALRRENAFTPADVTLAGLLAAQVAAALANVERLEAMQTQFETLAARVEALELLNQELDAYDYSAAHDLKAPLNIANNYAFLLQDALSDGHSEDAAAFAGEIERTVRGMARLLDQLLLVTRAADDDDVPPATAVHPVLEQVQAQFRQLLDQGGIRLTVAGDLPDVSAYPVQLETIFSNLIGNAIKYMGEAADPTITIYGVADDTQAYFEVRDNGIGMSEAEQAKLFRRFSRVGSKEAEGTGLGLAIARRTVERLGGSLGVTSAPGQGSTFSFSLPLARREG